jgi:hypothetical protein
MAVKQVSVFVENKAGRLAAILEALERKQINIRAVTVSDAADIGIVRLILTDAELGLSELHQVGFSARIDLVLNIEILDDTPGGLLRNVIKPLADAGINVHYLYAYTDPSTNKPVAVIKTNDLEKAEKILKQTWGNK